MPPVHRRVLFWACAALVAGGIALAAVVPPYALGDETAHLDYAYQVWHGALPEFSAGLVLDPGQGVVPAVQWVAQHPPLTYLVLAPVVGPLVDAGHPLLAAYAGRAVTLAMALATVAASGWAARWLTGRWGRVALLVPVLAAANTWVLRLGGAVYNDVLLMLVVTVLFGMTGRWVRVGRGGTWSSLAWCAAVAAAAATRLSGVPLALLCVATVAASLLVRRSRNAGDWLWGVLLPPLAMIAGSGWFYWRNRELTGSITGAQPEWAAEHLERVTRTVPEVIVDPGFWRLSARLFAQSPAPLGDVLNLVLFLVPAALGVVAGIRAVRRRRSRADDLLVLGLCVAAAAGITLQQLMYVAVGGGAMARYFTVLLPAALVAVAVGMSRPLSARVRAVVMLSWVLVHLIDLAWDLDAVLDRFGGRSGPLPTVPDPVVWVAFAAHALLLLAACAAASLGRSEAGRTGVDPVSPARPRHLATSPSPA
ncbi:hypothetical protein [Cellulomonas sp. RIT-PI-Y]|uniref:hypothetical protein n=1 Tax=Cellulomonas sp. RIT-PI-Y TaxID=3035297 RepID=UPI0021DA499C|nr:hypothetical protein [Cellulomonas sp. RIT-PI-Y]